MVLKDKTAIVTGGSRGFGKEVALYFVKAGADVVICSRTKSELDSAIKELNECCGSVKAHGFITDVSNEQSVDKFVLNAAEILGGKIDCLVNNAGIYGPKGNIDIVDIEKWKSAFNINIMGVIYMCRAVIPYMKKNGKGKIINLSGGGATSPIPGGSAYAATKAAVVRLTETVALEMNEYNIFVNALAPGALNTRMMKEMLEEGKGKLGKQFYEKVVQQKESGGTPLSKGAETCVYLASDKSDGITGKLISAVWDNWAELHNDINRFAPDVYTLRRIVPEDRQTK